ncbi:hypothetical protein C8Q72DRAFT_578674 [Fomitopsis betulina]|nr:hypothetical protein C8Q72DRAFT_578674 [Fomitopsis betulina]
MHLKSLRPKHLLCLSIRLPWMSHSTDKHLCELLNTASQQQLPVKTLQSHYLTADPTVYSCYVSKISLWKRKQFPNHEFVIVHFICRGKDVGALRMERTVLLSDDGSSATSSRTSLASSSSPAAANDFLTIYESTDIAAATKDASLVITHAIPEEQHITPAAVIAACSVISEKEPAYKLRTKQCFWFAGLAIRLIAGDDTVAQTQSADGNSKLAAGAASFWQVMG